MRHTFHTSQWVPYPIEKVFSFFADPSNLPRLMPDWQKPRIDRSALVTPPAPPGEASNHQSCAQVAGTGSTMTISFRPLSLAPIRVRWDALIAEFKWNTHFCDEQVKGPFAYWRHCHRVSEEERNSKDGTMVVDDLTYELPFGFLAEPVNSLFVRGQIEEIFAHRQRRLLELL